MAFDLGIVQAAAMQNPMDILCARMLRDTVSAGPMPHPPFNQKNWAEQFAVFRRHMKDDAPRIEKVLKWYCDNRKKLAANLPTVKSVKQFRTTFDWIERVMKKNTVTEIEVSPRALAIVGRLGIGGGWPKGSANQVPRLVEISIRNHEEWVSAVRKLYLETADSALARFIVYAGTKVFGTDNFLQIWFADAHRSVKSWKGFSGDLTPWAWRADHRVFNQTMLGVATEYGDPKAWEKLKAAMEDKNEG
jgi:hypothetical protein